MVFMEDAMVNNERRAIVTKANVSKVHGDTVLQGRELTTVERLEGELYDHMYQTHQRRYEHSLSVAETAEHMALAYGVNPFEARVAGVLHDWDKVLSTHEQIAKAQRLGIDLGVDYQLVAGLLHGMTAALDLEKRYPGLPKSIWQAIDRHTIGATDMSPLDMVIFVADGIEPLRNESDGIAKVRSMVWRQAPLEDVFWASFSGGVRYVIDTERYLYPGTLNIYNTLVRSKRKG